MSKPMKWMVIFLAVVFGGIIGFNLVRTYFTNQFFAHFKPPPAHIAAHPALEETWHPYLSSIGNFVAQKGVEINSEVGGIVTKISFESGQHVEEGALLVQLDDSVDQATLLDNQALLTLAELNYKRQMELIKTNATSISAVDQARSQLKSAEASIAKTKALIAQKHITAPFSGQLGIRKINLGDYVTAGTTKMVSLQWLDELFIEFTVPEQQLPNLATDQPIKITSDAFPGKAFNGKISAINSKVDPQTHNVLAQAIVPNPKHKLLPGMFGHIAIELPALNQVVTVPNTAIDYTLYGDSVFVVKKDQTVERTFVVVGEQQNNRVMIKSGLKPGDIVVDSGQLKLQNGASVIVDNSVEMGQ